MTTPDKLLLVDNGKEFEDTLYIETANQGQKRTMLFYCDPYSSYQKPHVEKNHEHIRQILSKRTNFNGLTQDDVNKMMSHINSYARDSLGGKTPCYYDGSKLLGEDFYKDNVLQYKLRFIYDAHGISGVDYNGTKYGYIKDGLGNVTGVTLNGNIEGSVFI